jgi:hypothetical protein
MNDEETLTGDAITSQARKEAGRSSCEMAVTAGRLQRNEITIRKNPFDRLAFAQLVKKFPCFCGSRKFIAVFTTARY